MGHWLLTLQLYLQHTLCQGRSAIQQQRQTPTKSEIRFKDERYVFKTVFDTGHKALRESIEGEFNIEEDNDFKVNKYEVNQLSLDSEIEKLNSLKETISKSNIEFNNSNKDTVYDNKMTKVDLPLDFLSSSLDSNKLDNTCENSSKNLGNI